MKVCNPNVIINIHKTCGNKKVHPAFIESNSVAQRTFNCFQYCELNAPKRVSLVNFSMIEHNENSIDFNTAYIMPMKVATVSLIKLNTRWKIHNTSVLKLSYQMKNSTKGSLTPCTRILAEHGGNKNTRSDNVLNNKTTADD